MTSAMAMGELDEDGLDDDQVYQQGICQRTLMDQTTQCVRRKLTPRRRERADMEPSSLGQNDCNGTVEDEVINGRRKDKGKEKVLEDDNEEPFFEGDLEDGVEGYDLCEEDNDGADSDNSIECGDQFIQELQYDADELIHIRELNINLRRVQKNSVEPVPASQISWVDPLARCENHEDGGMHDSLVLDSEKQPITDAPYEGKSVPSSKWPSYWTTYEGGYYSDQRDTDDEGPINEDEDEESQVDHVVVRTKKGKRKVDYPFFNEKTDMRNVYFEVGLRFVSQKVLKEAILWYSIQKKKDIRYIKNDKKRIHVGCHGCRWEMSAGRDLEHMDAWQIKAYHGEHRCARTFRNKLITENWIAEQFLDKVLRNSKMTSREIKEDIRSKYDILVHTKMCLRAKNNALSAVTNLMKRQYGILKPYLRELCKANPGTRCVLKTVEAPPGQLAVFLKFYVCYDALKKGFVETCRPIIGVDGCFLKHACGGQLLCAVGRDGNNHMYPIAWAVVAVENRITWEWFLKLVGEDLNMGFGDGWTVISDQQKGLVQAIHALWPNIEHRQCARHILSNWRKVHKGRELERQFWKCVKATTMGQFHAEVTDLKNLSKDAYDAFMSRDPNTFCKSHFKTHSNCDVVDNNMAETFNSFILLARYKPIVSMLEDIRLALMDRMKQKKEEASKFVAGVAPRISEKLEEAYDEQRHCDCRWNGGDTQTGFEVLHKGISHAVDLEKKTCSCRVWELTGVPCCHAMSAILYMNKKPEDYLAAWYKVETYTQTYSRLLQPVPGSIFWDADDGVGMVLPPDVERRRPGRRKTNRRRDADEPKKKTTYCRNGLPTKCSNCGNADHDKRKCQVPQREVNQCSMEHGAKKRGRPKGSKNRIGRDDSSTPAQYIASLKKSKASTKTFETTSLDPQSDPHSSAWLSSVTTKANQRGRGKGRTFTRGRSLASGGRGRGRATGGIGISYGDNGQIIYSATSHRPGIVIREPQSQP